MTCWPSLAQHVGALGHEVHAAEDDVLGVGLGGDLRELVAVAGEVGEADHFVALVVVAEQDGGCAQLRARLGNALVHGVVGKRQVVFKAATRCRPRGETAVTSSRTRFTVFRLQSSRLPIGSADGDVESKHGCSGCTVVLALKRRL